MLQTPGLGHWGPAHTYIHTYIQDEEKCMAKSRKG